MRPRSRSSSSETPLTSSRSSTEPHARRIQNMQSSDLKNLSIAIIGAGYGGAAAAKALSLLGASVHVYEQATQIREIGAGIGLRPPTLDLFRTWGIFGEMARVSSPSDYFEILTATGQPIMR